MAIELTLTWQSLVYFVPMLIAVYGIIKYINKKETCLITLTNKIIALQDKVEKISKKNIEYDRNFNRIELDLVEHFKDSGIQTEYLKLVLKKLEIPYPESKK